MTSTQIVRDTLARFREKPSIGLDITFPIYWQMDADLGRVLSSDLGSHGSWEVMRATRSLARHIPAKTGLYMFVYRSHLKLAMPNDGELKPTWVLYVGRAGSSESTRTLRDRYKNEYAKYIGRAPENLWDESPIRNRAENLGRYLSIWPLEYWYLVVEDRGNIPHLEDRLIKLLAPPINRIGRLKVKKGEPTPAFRTPE